MENKYIEKFKKNLSKRDRDELAKKCFIYDKYFEMLKKYVRFKADELKDINTGYKKAIEIYKNKLYQINAICYVLRMIYSDNNYYDLASRDLFSWSIELIGSGLRDYLEYEYKDLFIGDDDKI